MLSAAYICHVPKVRARSALCCGAHVLKPGLDSMPEYGKTTTGLLQHFGHAIPESVFLCLRDTDKIDRVWWFELFVLNFPPKRVFKVVSAPPSGRPQLFIGETIWELL